MSETVLLAIITATQAVFIALGVAWIQARAKERENRAQDAHADLTQKVEEVKQEVKNIQ